MPPVCIDEAILGGRILPSAYTETGDPYGISMRDGRKKSQGGEALAWRILLVEKSSRIQRSLLRIGTQQHPGTATTTWRAQKLIARLLSSSSRNVAAQPSHG